MAMTPVTVGDNPFLPGASAFQYIPDQLIAGDLHLVTHNIEVMQGGVYLRGTVMGRQTTFTILAARSGTGNGTITGLTPGPGLMSSGIYSLTATSATNFTVVDPEGNSLPNATVGTAYTNNALNFTITAGGTAFVAGDTFTLTANRTVGNFVPCVKTASDGSQTPACILVDNVDATLGPVLCGGYFAGEFNANAVTYDSSWVLADLGAALQPRGIHLKSAVIAADPVNA